VSGNGQVEADRDRLQKAVEARGVPTDLRQWSEVSLFPLNTYVLSLTHPTV